MDSQYHYLAFHRQMLASEVSFPVNLLAFLYTHTKHVEIQFYYTRYV